MAAVIPVRRAVTVKVGVIRELQSSALKLQRRLAWTDSTADTITLYRGATDPYWNYVRVRIWKIKEIP